MRPHCVALAILGAAFSAASAAAQTDSYTDSIFRARFSANAPGAAVAVVRNGRVEHVGTYGLADVEKRSPITPRTSFYLASVAKPFTALAIQLLVRDGVLRYEDRLVRWLPELSSSDSSITIRHLLTHSSGLADFYSFIDWPRFRRLDNAGVLDTTRAHPKPLFPPGTRYEYSNTGYVLLSLIIERATGKPLGELLAARVFGPLRMASSVVYDDTAKHVPERAKAYQRNEGRVLLSDIDALEFPDGQVVRFTFLQTGQGGLFASIADMAGWVTALLDTTMLTAREKNEVFRQRVASPAQSGIPVVQGVGYGWFISKRSNVDVMWHDGSRGGSRTAVVLVPNARLGVVVLSNFGDTDPLGLATLLVDRWLGAGS
jgi:CubicO group peptidase (beta-lactamase class C family)